MRINHNIAALNTYRQLTMNTTSGSKSLEKLSSGLRINRAGDDAAGLAISEKMRGQIRGLDQATRNSQDAISLIQTAEGALNETHAILQRMRELAVQSATDTNTIDDRQKIQSEVDQLAKEITRISNTTEFNTQNLMAGGFDSTFHIGANEGQNVKLTIGQMDAKALGVSGDLISYGLDSSETGVTSVSNPSQDLSGYKIVTSAVVNAGVSEVSESNGSLGDLSITDATSYNGSTNKNITIRIDSVDDPATGKVSTASISYDGGTNWSAMTLDTSGTDATANIDGLNITLTTGDGNTVNGTWSFNATAEYKNVQLQTSDDTAVGGIVKVYNNQTSATIGLGDETVNIGFSYSTLASEAQTDSITKTTSESTSAVLTAKGEIAQIAVTQKGIDVSNQTASNSAITKINDAITKVSEERAKLGAMQNRLEHTINNLETSSENLTASESRIRDVDMAKEMMEFTKNNILQQAATAMLAQANQQPQGVLQLLQ